MTVTDHDRGLGSQKLPELLFASESIHQEAMLVFPHLAGQCYDVLYDERSKALLPVAIKNERVFESTARQTRVRIGFVGLGQRRLRGVFSSWLSPSSESSLSSSESNSLLSIEDFCAQLFGRLNRSSLKGKSLFIETRLFKNTDRMVQHRDNLEQSALFRSLASCTNIALLSLRVSIVVKEGGRLIMDDEPPLECPTDFHKQLEPHLGTAHGRRSGFSDRNLFQIHEPAEWELKYWEWNFYPVINRLVRKALKEGKAPAKILKEL